MHLFSILSSAAFLTQEEREEIAERKRDRIRAKDDMNDEAYEERLGDDLGDIMNDTLVKNKVAWIVPDQLRIPLYIWNNLYGYQKEAVEWMWTLHSDQTGGILADEMGLGKTIQIIAFLAALHCSGILQDLKTRKNGTGVSRTGGVLIIAPATLVEQWRQEIHSWYPPLRVSVIASGVDKKVRKEMLMAQTGDGNCGVILTSYETFRLKESEILEYPFSYVILDEGQKIRNPDALVTQSCKRIDTPHRLVLTGTPIQNKLSELWSISDFFQPGLLGTFPVFN